MTLRRLLVRALPLAAIPLLGSCVAPKEVAAPAPVAQPTVIAPPPPVASRDWTDGPLTPGGWSYAPQAGGGAARFAAAGGATTFALVCAAGDMALTRGGGAPFVVTTTSAARTFQPGADGAAHLAPRDGFLDQMAFSRGRIMVRGGTLPTLVLPVQAEIGRVVEDCRG